jgi:predicted lipoprotein with Yx(FWY)xxD motif
MYAFALLAALAALFVAGCGGGGSSSTDTGSSEAATTESSSPSGEATTQAGAESGAAVLTGSSVSGLGTVLVDAEGMTVYMYAPDKNGESTCYGDCESEWPPVSTKGKPSAGEGAVAAALGTTKRKDGTTQVTYEGHPVYTFADDKAPGEANGNGDGGVWFALDEGGNAVKGKATTTASDESAPAEEEESSGGASHGGY